MQTLHLFTLILTIGLAATSIAVADMAKPSQTGMGIKIATIVKMYQQDVDNQGDDYPVVLQQYGSQDLQAAMQLEQDYFDREQMSCNVDYDVLWSSQDPDYAQDKQFSMTEQGLVQVSLAQGSDIYYDLSCDGTDNKTACHIADVILEDNTSLKHYLIESCR